HSPRRVIRPEAGMQMSSRSDKLRRAALLARPSEGKPGLLRIAAKKALRQRSLDVVAEIATESVGLLHQRLAPNDFLKLPIILGVFHVARLLATDDDDRTDQLVISAAEVHFAHD